MPIMDGPLPAVPLQYGDMTRMLDLFYNQLSSLIEENSKKAQEMLQIGLSRTQDELDLVKREMETAKAMLEAQTDHITGLLRKTPTEETKPVIVGVLQRVEHQQSTEIHDLKESKRQLADRYASLESTYATLSSDHRDLKSKHQDVEQCLSTTQRKLEEAENKARTFRIQVGRLQGHLTKNATNANELIDSDVKAKLEIIRARTQSIVKKFCVGSTAPVDRKIEEFADFDNEWVKKKKSISEHNDIEEFQTYWVRSKIYMLLERAIFNQKVFGLEVDLEAKLAELEGQFLKHNPHSDISDWRALTVRYSKSLRMTNERLPDQTALYIAHLFHPWTVGNPANLVSPKGTQGPKRYQNPPQLLPDLTELCRTAYDLAVMLRQSTEMYHFVAIKEGTKVESQEPEDFEPEDMIGPKSKYVGSKVWVTLFGALVKESQAGERHVMVKARVICKAPQPLPSRSTSPRKNEG